jgi:hypothetical protein
VVFHTLNCCECVEDQSIWALSVDGTVFLQIPIRGNMKIPLSRIVGSVRIRNSPDERPGDLAQRVEGETVDNDGEYLSIISNYPGANKLSKQQVSILEAGRRRQHILPEAKPHR